MTVDHKILTKMPGRVTNDDLRRLTNRLHENGLLTSCLSCIHFNESGTKRNVFDPDAQQNLPPETCMLYNVRPPARVIALGCEKWDDVPF